MGSVDELQLLEPGAQCSCDHCKRYFQVARLEQLTIVFVKPINAPAGFRR
jgi:hypothetical protein